MNATGKNIIASGARADYDTEAINLLKDRQFLARILKECTTEFSGMPVVEIISCIDDPRVGEIPVEPGLSNTTLVGGPTESKVIGEGTLTYDIRFTAHVPGKEKKDRKNIAIHLLIDVELQNKEMPGYDLVPRGMLYCGRMLSEQMGTHIKRSNYDSLKKVYSIWICVNSANVRANTISRYRIVHEPVHGTFKEKGRFDLMQVVMIRLPDEEKKTKPRNKPTPLMELLSLLLSEKTDSTEKLQKVQSFGITVTEEIEGRINVMCNLGQGMIERSIKRGMKQGMEQGMEQGMKQGRENLILEMLMNGKTPEEIADFSGVKLDEIKKIEAKHMAIA